MQPILVLPREIRGIVGMEAAVDAVRTGFREWGENPQLNAPRRRIHIPTGVRVSAPGRRSGGAGYRAYGTLRVGRTDGRRASLSPPEPSRDRALRCR